MQTLIMDMLTVSSIPISTTKLRDRYAWEIAWDSDRDPAFDTWNTAARRRSIRMSIGRALRQLEAAGQIKRDGEGNWFPAKDWSARDLAERERATAAYHEAGHAVIGLALKLPVAFVTIKPRRRDGGHVSYAPTHHSIGEVYARGAYYYHKPLADMSNQDAFGNPVSARNNDWHADAVMSIAGGMSEARFVSNGCTWRELASPTDKRYVALDRRKLGDKARSVEEYAVQCEKLIKQYWLMIEAVAEKLLKEETLSGSDVYSICWRVARDVVRRQHIRRPKSTRRSRDIRKVAND
jgi:hypothetical protein